LNSILAARLIQRFTDPNASALAARLSDCTSRRVEQIAHERRHRLPTPLHFFHADKRTLGDCCQLAEIAAFLFSAQSRTTQAIATWLNWRFDAFRERFARSKTCRLRIGNEIGWRHLPCGRPLRRGGNYANRKPTRKNLVVEATPGKTGSTLTQHNSTYNVNPARRVEYSGKTDVGRAP